MIDQRLAKLAADTIRVLSAEGVQKAKSGHPGMPMGCADYAFVLWYKYLRHNPKNPQWLGRDRFVLSAGHGSMLIYSLLHLFEYGLTKEDLESFRQWGSKTPGHPEYHHTRGVEITTGPLGSGFGSAVGMAIAAKYFAAKTGLDKTGLVNGKMYILSGDGCMMEGNTAEAASLAGHLKLDNVIAFYDSNTISIEGCTGLAFTEDVGARFTAYGWRVLHCDNANDAQQIDKVLAEAQQTDGRPTLIIGKTTIGFGAPNKAGKASSHGEPLGDEELAGLKKNLGWTEAPFTVPAEVKKMISGRLQELDTEMAKWDQEFQGFLKAHPDQQELIDKMLNRTVPADILQQLLAAAPLDKPVATRASGGAILQKAASLVPALIGGSADLAPSTKTNVKDGGDFSAANYVGRNLHFGIRELEMGMCGNGMALYGTAIPYTSTFAVFSDYMKPAIRLASLQKLHEIYVFTHDSFYVGEDGPTHEPIEQLAMLRTIPDMTVLRPAEAHEVAHAWALALQANGPVAMMLTRQDLKPYSEKQAKNIDMKRGAYVIDEDDGGYDVILIGTGSEVNLALEAADILRTKGIQVRVVSMPSMETFFRQPQEYQDQVLPPDCIARVSIEAGTTFGWHRIVGSAGLAIGLDHFGASAPYKKLADEFGFTAEKVVAAIEQHFSCGGSCDCCNGGCH